MSHGHYRGGNYTAYRHGAKKKPKKQAAHIVVGDARKITINEVMQVLRDWRYSEFENEAACLYGLRVAFCLQGHGWERSNTEARALVNSAITFLGYQRPDWDQGQREFVTPEENCNWCGVEMEVDKSRRDRFCSVECARAAIQKRDYENSYKETLTGNAAYRLIMRSKTTVRLCKTCGDRFHPDFENSSQAFCSYKCSGAARRSLPDRSCKHCKILFRPSKPTQFYCGLSCVRAAPVQREYDCFCIWCSKSFKAGTQHAKFCHVNCKSMEYQMRTGRKVPKMIRPAVFDHFFITLAA